MLEYNADTPTGLIEAAVAQWFWLQDVFPEKDQWNGIHEALIRQWKKLQYRTGMSTLHVAHSEAEESGEDWMTAAYMRDVASQAGWTTIGINMSDIGWDPNLNRFVDLDNFLISTIFKLYPWELMMKEPFGHRLLQRAHNPRWVEPAWKMLLSNKALLAALWHLYPDHPNLLPAYLDGPGPLKEWVAKPLHGREGDNIRIHAAGIEPRAARRLRPRRLVLPAVPCPARLRRQPSGPRAVGGGRRIGRLRHPRVRRPRHRLLLPLRAEHDRRSGAASAGVPGPGLLQQGRYRTMSTGRRRRRPAARAARRRFPPRGCAPASWTSATP